MGQVTYEVRAMVTEDGWIPTVIIILDYGYCIRQIPWQGKEARNSEDQAREDGERIAKRLIREHYQHYE